MITSLEDNASKLNIIMPLRTDLSWYFGPIMMFCKTFILINACILCYFYKFLNTYFGDL